MLVSRNIAYLSGDFRLTYSNNRHLDELDTQKLIPIFRYGWGALIAYSGVAKAPPFVSDMGNWILAKINSIPMKGKIEELPQKLLEVNQWINKIQGDKRLTFSVVGFVGRRPFMMVISNCVDREGRETQLQPELVWRESRPKQAEVKVMGDRSSVLPEEKEQLRKLLQENKDYLTVRNHIAEINTKAADRSLGQVISRQCVIGYILPSGAAEIIPFGIMAGQLYMPSFVLRDLWKQGIVGFNHKHDEDGNLLNPYWVGMNAKIQGGQGKDAVVAELHAIRNVDEPIYDGIHRENAWSFWRVAGPNEPKTYKFTLNKSLHTPMRSGKKQHD